MIDYFTLQCVHENLIDPKDRVMFLHGSAEPDSDQDGGVNWKMANQFHKNIYLLDKSPDPIIIHQHSIGGEHPSGMMIYDLIKNSKSHSTMICHGEVCSMGTVILQAPDVRLAMPSCSFLIHYGFTSGDGAYQDVQNRSRFEHILTTRMLDIYAERCCEGEYFKGKNKSKVRNFLYTKLKSGDWWLDAKEAKYYGFIDGILHVDVDIQDI